MCQIFSVLPLFYHTLWDFVFVLVLFFQPYLLNNSQQKQQDHYYVLDRTVQPCSYFMRLTQTYALEVNVMHLCQTYYYFTWNITHVYCCGSKRNEINGDINTNAIMLPAACTFQLVHSNVWFNFCTDILSVSCNESPCRTSLCNAYTPIGTQFSATLL